MSIHIYLSIDIGFLFIISLLLSSRNLSRLFICHRRDCVHSDQHDILRCHLHEWVSSQQIHSRLFADWRHYGNHKAIAHTVAVCTDKRTGPSRRTFTTSRHPIDAELVHIRMVSDRLILDLSRIRAQLYPVERAVLQSHTLHICILADNFRLHNLCGICDDFNIADDHQCYHQCENDKHEYARGDKRLVPFIIEVRIVTFSFLRKSCPKICQWISEYMTWGVRRRD